MDYSTGFADADGKLVAQGLTLPGHLGSVPTAMESIMRHYRRRHGRGRRLHHERPVRRRHAPARHLRLQAALSRGRAARLRLHRLPPHRRRRPRRRLERLGLDRDLRRGPAHRAAQALRGGQAQQDHHDLHREERAPAGEGVRRSARAARRLPHRRAAVRRAGGQATAPAQTTRLHARDGRLCRAPDARRARASCPTANGASRTGSTTTASTTASRSACSSPSARRATTWWSTGPAPIRR